jgi:hypothetical protein
VTTVDNNAKYMRSRCGNDFPRYLRVEGLWVRDDLDHGHVLDGRRQALTRFMRAV